MPRTARASVGGVWYHVVNRGNRREAVFHKSGDYDAFVEASSDARTRLPLDILGYCLMPNHFHLVIRPQGDGDLGRWVQWSLMAHPRRYHRQYRTSGHVWQGRFKAFPIQDDDHLRTVGLPDTRRLPFAEGGVADTHRLARGILIAANHSEWGCLEPPFVRRGEGEVKVGARLHVTIQPSGRKGMSFRPTVLVADPERELRWLGRFLLPGLFDGEHSFGEMRSSWSQCHEPHVARAAAAWVCRRHTEVSLRELSQWPGVRSKPPAYSERMNPSAVTTILAAFTRKRDRRRGRDGLLRSSISTVLFSSAATAERWLAFRRR